jgi:hypothetical protein
VSQQPHAGRGHAVAAEAEQLGARATGGAAPRPGAHRAGRPTARRRRGRCGAGPSFRCAPAGYHCSQSRTRMRARRGASTVGVAGSVPCARPALTPDAQQRHVSASVPRSRAPRPAPAGRRVRSPGPRAVPRNAAMKLSSSWPAAPRRHPRAESARRGPGCRRGRSAARSRRRRVARSCMAPQRRPGMLPGDRRPGLQPQVLALAGRQVQADVAGPLEEADLAHPLERHPARRQVRDAAALELEARVRDVDARREHRHADGGQRRTGRFIRLSTRSRSWIIRSSTTATSVPRGPNGARRCDSTKSGSPGTARTHAAPR